MKKINSNKSIYSRKKIFTIAGIGVFLFLISITIYVGNSKQKSTLNEQQLNQEVFLNSVVNANANLIFFKDDCPYCKAAEQTVLKAGNESEFPTFFIDLNSPEGQTLKVKYNVKYAATLVTIRNGKTRNELYSTKIKGKYKANTKIIDKELIENNSPLRRD